MGVPVMDHFRVDTRCRVISAAFVVPRSTVCASSRHTRHHATWVSAVGITLYRFRYRKPRTGPLVKRGSPAMRSVSRAKTSYVVRTRSDVARTCGSTTVALPATASLPWLA